MSMSKRTAKILGDATLFLTIVAAIFFAPSKSEMIANDYAMLNYVYNFVLGTFIVSLLTLLVTFSRMKLALWKVILGSPSIAMFISLIMLAVLDGYKVAVSAPEGLAFLTDLPVLTLVMLITFIIYLWHSMVNRSQEFSS